MMTVASLHEYRNSGMGISSSFNSGTGVKLVNVIKGAQARLSKVAGSKFWCAQQIWFKACQACQDVACGGCNDPDQPREAPA